MPDWSLYVRRRLPPLRVSPERESEIVAELAQQMEQAFQASLRGGASQTEALQRARTQFPNWDTLAAEIMAAEREAAPPLPPERSARWFTGALHDLRYAARMLRKNPGFALIAMLTLAFGIGANTAVFSVVDALVLRRLPYPDPDRLMAIETRESRQLVYQAWTSAPGFFDFRERNRAFDSVAAVSPIWNVVRADRSGAERLEALYVSAALFPLLGVQAAAGRTLLPSEDERTKPSKVVVLSHAFWMRRFNGSPAAIGQVLDLDASPHTIVGVLPADFRYLGEPVAGTASDIDVWLPLSDNPIVTGSRGLRFLKLIGRRKPGVAVEQARDDVRRLGQAFAAQFPASDRGYEMDALPLAAQVAGRLRSTSLLLLASVGFVLLIACANVSTLLLTRTAARRREISVRIALGASGARLLRQLLAEGLLLALAGGIAGWLLAYGAVKLVLALGPASLVHARAIGLDTRALLFTSLVVLASAVLPALLPGWRVLRSDIASALREAGRGVTFAAHGLRSALVVIEIALALVLLIGAGLLIHSFVRLLDVDPGFNARNLVTISTQIPIGAATPAQRAATYRLIREKMLSISGVVDVAAVSRMPMLGLELSSSMWIEGRTNTMAGAPVVEYRAATVNYLQVMGIPLRRGRMLESRDDAPGGPWVALIDEATARKYFANEDPVGKRVRFGPNPESLQWQTIVGVVGSVRHFGLDAEPRPMVYLPARPLSAPILVIRTTADPRPLTPALSGAVRAVNPGCPVYNVFPLEELVARSTGQRGFVMSVLIAFAAAALLLAAVGIYGIASQSVVQRTSEIGLRMALGATPHGALGLILREGMRLVLIGAGAGLFGGAALARLMQGLLFGVAPLDGPVFGLAVAGLAAIALLACLPPALRATRVDPLVALRCD